MKTAKAKNIVSILTENALFLIGTGIFLGFIDILLF